MKMNNGDRVMDPITGFTGIVVCRLEYLNGCTRLQVQPETLADDGKLSEPGYFDEPQMRILNVGVHKGQQTTGGFKDAPASRYTDRR